MIAPPPWRRASLIFPPKCNAAILAPSERRVSRTSCHTRSLLGCGGNGLSSRIICPGCWDNRRSCICRYISADFTVRRGATLPGGPPAYPSATIGAAETRAAMANARVSLRNMTCSFFGAIVSEDSSTNNNNRSTVLAICRRFLRAGDVLMPNGFLGMRSGFVQR